MSGNTHAVRNAASSTLRWLGTHPEAWGALGHAERPSQRNDPLVPVRWSEATLDHPVHRYLAWLVDRAMALLHRVCLRLRVEEEVQPGDVAAGWCGARATQLERALAVLDRARTRTWLRSIAAAPLSEAALLALLDDPAYARLHALLRRFVRPLFALGDSTGLAAPIRATYDLYELWCFLALQRALAGTFPGATWSSRGVTSEAFLEGNGHGAAYIALLPAGRLELHFNLTFTGYLSRGGSDRFSVSGERRPDFVVSWVPVQGQPRWLALDAKYRVGPSQLADAFTSAHIYRDSLRWEGRGGRCEAALLLVPNLLPPCAPWFGEAFLEEHRVGACALAPETNMAAFGRRVLRLFGRDMPHTPETT